MFRRFLILPVLTCILVLFGASTNLHAQAFEGMIEFKRQAGEDITNYVYYVKGDKVRIDEFAPGTRSVVSSYIVDLKQRTSVHLAHKAKTWSIRDKKDSLVPLQGTQVSSTKDMKDMFGYKCTEQVVRTDSVQVCYYVAEGKFNFFLPMLKMQNRHSAFAYFYLALSPKTGDMPLLSIKKDLSGKEISRLEVTRIDQRALSDGVFEIPKDYKESAK